MVVSQTTKLFEKHCTKKIGTKFFFCINKKKSTALKSHRQVRSRAKAKMYAILYNPFVSANTFNSHTKEITSKLYFIQKW